MKQQGYTLVELIISVGMIAVVALIGLAIYAVIHFVGKFW